MIIINCPPSVEVSQIRVKNCIEKSGSYIDHQGREEIGLLLLVVAKMILNGLGEKE